MEVGSVFVTGANRGIGLEFVRQLVNLSKPPRYVFATYRNKDTIDALKSIAESSKECQVSLLQMDVRKAADVEAARRIVESVLGDKGLNLLINNAGIFKSQTFPQITEENMLFHFTTNTLGPIKVAKAMLPFLQKAAVDVSGGMGIHRALVLNISSRGASQTNLDGWQDLGPGQRSEWITAMGYKVSKAALNMAMRMVAIEVKKDGILVVNMCPGWVRTALGTERGTISVTESVSAILETLQTLNETDHGAYLDRCGTTIPF